MAILLLMADSIEIDRIRASDPEISKRRSIAMKGRFISRVISLAAAVILLSGVPMQVDAASLNVLLLSTGNAAEDSAVVSLLTARGDSVTVGPQYINFDGTTNLTP
jgi:hypothetical protein